MGGDDAGLTKSQQCLDWLSRRWDAKARVGMAVACPCKATSGHNSLQLWWYLVHFVAQNIDVHVRRSAVVALLEHVWKLALCRAGALAHTPARWEQQISPSRHGHSPGASLPHPRALRSRRRSRCSRTRQRVSVPRVLSGAAVRAGWRRTHPTSSRGRSTFSTGSDLLISTKSSAIACAPCPRALK